MSNRAPRNPPQNGNFQRETFRTSRRLDYCTEKELTAQTGFGKHLWPTYAVHELFDNALDACEDCGIAPEVELLVDDRRIEVRDNGPGIAPETVEHLLDFDYRVSSRETYVSPCRGAQGNALKTLVMMPYVLDGQEGVIEITARGVRHVIRVGLDRVAQQPEIEHETARVAEQPGTAILLHWPETSKGTLTNAGERIADLAEDYTFFNPHLSVQVNCFGREATIDRSGSDWKKWTPAQPPCARWYAPEDFAKHIGACVTKDRSENKDRTVREFITGFAGLTSTAKQAAILDEADMKRTKLSELVRDKDVDPQRAGLLLALMQRETKRGKPVDLGFVGKDHFSNRFAEMGCQMESFRYGRAPRRPGEPMDVPWNAETAFAWAPGRKRRRLVLGVNWSPCIVNPFRTLGRDADGWDRCGLDSLLEQQRAGSDAPVIFALHLTSARVRYTDRGKTALVMHD